LFGILLINNQESPGTAVKALTISGSADLLLMLGIILTTYLAGTGNLSEISKLPIQGIGILGFLCLMFGAIGKAGSMPFHSWIPNASDDAPTVFMVAFPASLEKILGIYFAARIPIGINIPGLVSLTSCLPFGNSSLPKNKERPIFKKDSAVKKAPKSAPR